MLSTRRDEEFTEFVAARLPALRRLAYLLCQDWHRADDLVQEAITRLYMHWNRVRAMEHTEAYVRTILVREFLTERRSGWVRRVRLDGDALPQPGGQGPDKDAALDLRAALSGLPPRQRATIVLRFYDDLTVEQVAVVLGCSPGTVKSQTSKALWSLRRVLEPASEPDQAAGGPSRRAITIAREVRGHG